MLGRARPGWLPAGVAFAETPLDPGTEFRRALAGCGALVHAGFHHVPGRYRGGEGDDPDGFRRANADGTAALFRAAAAEGVARAVFLSSRAVWGGLPPGTPLTEEVPPAPDTLYAQVKLAGEAALAADGPPGTALRATGVYGPAPPGRRHKWADLFAAVARGETPPPRIGTEVHGADVAAAVALALAPGAPACLCVSDILLDRHDLVTMTARRLGVATPPPPRADAAAVSVMDAGRLRALGWHPGGHGRLRETLDDLLGAAGPSRDS